MNGTNQLGLRFRSVKVFVGVVNVLTMRAPSERPGSTAEAAACGVTAGLLMLAPGYIVSGKILSSSLAPRLGKKALALGLRDRRLSVRSRFSDLVSLFIRYIIDSNRNIVVDMVDN